MLDIHKLSIKGAHDGLKAKDFTSVELTRAYLDRIKKYNGQLNAYLTITDDIAISQAKNADENIKSGKQLKPLEGIPCAVKDIFVTKNVRTTASSKMLENFVPPYESTTTQRLLSQGMVMLGKTNCDAFAFGASTENSGYGPSKNPWNTKKVPGGSSGGSAVAVSAGLASYALGTDTGGSIRQPAALCGLTGLKLTYGLGSRYGLIAMASSFDTPGPMAKTVEDCALVLQHMAGFDENDGTTFNHTIPDYSKSLNSDIKGKKIAVLSQSYGDGVETDVKTAVKTAAETLASMGADVEEISMPDLKYGISVYYVLVPSEISSNMAKFDSVRFGHRTENYNSMIDMQSKSRGESLEDEVKRRIMLGNFALASGYYDAYYLKAAKVRTVIKQKFAQAFQKYDALISPTSPTVAFDIGSKSDDPLAMYLADIFTCPVNSAGIPALSVPCGFSKDKLPIGMQIIGKSLDEETIINIGFAYQQVTDWHNYVPDLKE
ncbi:MAG: Asp-tRNA(Asn)/Glu-tRNA(Gln) amidotransferase subunit GatA [bacterium]|nr:Asp-tRNA(Asn)/Glu-tRNA(Gln) amidotransferase subunit GatA [bacterium]